MKTNRIIGLFGVPLLALALTLAACGGGGGGTPGDPTPLPPDGEPNPGGSTPPAISGFDFTLATGNFWEYKWDYYYANSEGGGETDAGRFWVVLGPAKDIQGITAYEVEIYGKSKKRESSRTRSFGPSWKYVAITNNQVLGSTDGATLKPFFDAQLGMWAGGGFFTSFPNNLIIAQSGTINSSNNYVNGSAVVVGRSANQSLCEWIAGEYICTGSYSQTLIEEEYYRPGIGPVGYYYSNSTYFPSPPPMVFNWEHNVGLTASSFTGQTNPLINESEPNDSPAPATADAISTTTPIIGTVSQSTYANMGNTVISVMVIDDNGNAGWIQPTVEDWYSFSPSTSGTVTITLSFEGSPTADLDLFLMNPSGSALYSTNSYSVHDNPAREEQTETIKMNLPTGSYRIGVDGYLTPNGAVKYTLQLE